MIISELFDGWGNRILQQCFARSLGEELNYYVIGDKIPWLLNSGNYRPTKDCESYMNNEYFISHKSQNRHKVDIEYLKSLTPCKFRIHSYLEYYPNIIKHKDKIKSNWAVVQNPLQDGISSISKNFKMRVGKDFKNINIESVTPDDLVLSVRLGKDYLGMHKYRLLLGDYFKIVIESCEYDRLFITSQDPYNPILEDLYKYNPIFLNHISPVHTYNFVKQFNKIALSQSTYSWWAGYMSSANEIYFPITKNGPWSYGPNQRSKWKDYTHDLMVPEDRYKYVSYQNRDIIGDYKTARDVLQLPGI